MYCSQLPPHHASIVTLTPLPALALGLPGPTHTFMLMYIPEPLEHTGLWCWTDVGGWGDQVSLGKPHWSGVWVADSSSLGFARTWLALELGKVAWASVSFPARWRWADSSIPTSSRLVPFPLPVSLPDLPLGAITNLASSLQINWQPRRWEAHGRSLWRARVLEGEADAWTA